MKYLIRKNIPNLLTILRMFMLIPMVYALFHDAYGIALAFFMFAGISDGLDGFLARRYQWQTRFGSIIDPIADKILLITCFVSLYLLGQIPSWLLLVVLARDVIILIGAVSYHFVIGRYNMKPTMLSKINTVVQLFYILSLLINLALGWLPVWIVQGFMYMVLLATITSCLDYMVVWGNKAWRAAQAR